MEFQKVSNKQAGKENSVIDLKSVYKGVIGQSLPDVSLFTYAVKKVGLEIQYSSGASTVALILSQCQFHFFLLLLERFNSFLSLFGSSGISLS